MNIMNIWNSLTDWEVACVVLFLFGSGVTVFVLVLREPWKKWLFEKKRWPLWAFLFGIATVILGQIGGRLSQDGRLVDGTWVLLVLLGIGMGWWASRSWKLSLPTRSRKPVPGKKGEKPNHNALQDQPPTVS